MTSVARMHLTKNAESWCAEVYAQLNSHIRGIVTQGSSSKIDWRCRRSGEKTRCLHVLSIKYQANPSWPTCGQHHHAVPATLGRFLLCCCSCNTAHLTTKKSISMSLPRCTYQPLSNDIAMSGLRSYPIHILDLHGGPTSSPRRRPASNASDLKKSALYPRLFSIRMAVHQQ